VAGNPARVVGTRNAELILDLERRFLQRPDESPRDGS
jgi:hypothetical protein